MNLTEILYKTPKILYHGTLASNVPAILKDGLFVTKSKSSLSAIFLTDDISVAKNYSHMHSTSAKDSIAILAVDISMLDLNKLGPDNYELQEFLDGELGDVPEELEGLTYSDLSWEQSLEYVNQAAYYGNIPPKAISIVKKTLKHGWVI